MTAGEMIGEFLLWLFGSTVWHRTPFRPSLDYSLHSQFGPEGIIVDDYLAHIKFEFSPLFPFAFGGLLWTAIAFFWGAIRALCTL